MEEAEFEVMGEYIRRYHAINYGPVRRYRENTRGVAGDAVVVESSYKPDRGQGDGRGKRRGA